MGDDEQSRSSRRIKAIRATAVCISMCALVLGLGGAVTMAMYPDRLLGFAGRGFWHTSGVLSTHAFTIASWWNLAALLLLGGIALLAAERATRDKTRSGERLLSVRVSRSCLAITSVILACNAFASSVQRTDALTPGLRILFVENDEDFAETVIRQYLHDQSVVVVPTISGAIDRLSKRSFDVALVDYDLDDGKGDEFVRRVREQGVPLKIVTMSGHERGNQAIAEAGADAVCGKQRYREIRDILSTIGFSAEQPSSSEARSRDRRRDSSRRASATERVTRDLRDRPRTATKPRIPCLDLWNVCTWPD